MYILGDIGGTKMRIAGSYDLGSFDEPIIIDTPREYEAGVAAFVDAAKKISAGEKIEATAAGVPGTLSTDRSKLLGARHLPLWKGKSLQQDIEGALGGSVYLENDTAQVGLGEAVYGAGKRARVVVYITVSTGVNGVRVVDGSIDGEHAEIGGQYLAIADAPTGAARSLEELISGTAIAEKYGVHPKDIEKDSPVWEELARIAAFGIHNTILHWSPDRVVLGGSMFNEVGIPVLRVAAHVKEIMRKFPIVPDIVHSALTDKGGLWGGLARLKQLQRS